MAIHSLKTTLKACCAAAIAGVILLGLVVFGVSSYHQGDRDTKISSVSKPMERWERELDEQRRLSSKSIHGLQYGNDLPRLKRMLAAGSDPDETLEGYTLLMKISRFWIGDVRDRVAMAKTLLAAGADINAQKSGEGLNGFTPLMFAAGDDYFLTHFLLDQGADPTIKTADGWTALEWAKRSGEPRTVAALEEAIAQRKAQNITDSN